VRVQAVLRGTKGEGSCKMECGIVNVSACVFWVSHIGCMHVCTCVSARRAGVWPRHRAHAVPRSPGVAHVLPAPNTSRVASYIGMCSV